MDLKELYDLVNEKNILETYNLPYNFFIKPKKVLDQDTCLNEILYILSTSTFSFPYNDSSDVIELIENKDYNLMKDKYKMIEIVDNHKYINTPYVNNISDIFVILICFIKAYASHTYTHKGSFKEYLKDVFNVFYNLSFSSSIN
jgi:hypothetical protein